MKKLTKFIKDLKRLSFISMILNGNLFRNVKCTFLCVGLLFISALILKGQPEVDYVPVNKRGIEQMIVEKADASVVGDGFTRYRVFVDMVDYTAEDTLYGYQLTTGTNELGEMSITTTGEWFNPDVGFRFGDEINEIFFSSFPDLEYDSYLSTGGSGKSRIAVPYDVDQSGYITGTPVGTVLSPGLNADMFYNVNSSDDFVTSNGTFYGDPAFSGAGAGGVQGPYSSNILLIGQFTTDGDFAFDLNIQIFDKVFGSGRSVKDIIYPIPAQAPEYDTVPVQQYGIERMLIEKADASVVGDGFTRYRVFVDMVDYTAEDTLYGYQLTTGTPELGEMSITTTGEWFNSDVGFRFGDEINEIFFSSFPDLEYDSYLSTGGSGDERIAVPYDVDPSGYITGTSVGTVLSPGLNADMFYNANSSDDFVTSNGTFYGDPAFSGAGAGGVQGPYSSNILLIGQFTTDGDFAFDLNIQIFDKVFGSGRSVKDIIYPYDPVKVTESIASDLSFKLYPNPVVNNLTVEISSTNKHNTGVWKVYDMMGGMVTTGQINLDVLDAIEIDLSNLVSGIYVFEMACENEVYRKTFIKK